MSPGRTPILSLALAIALAACSEHPTGPGEATAVLDLELPRHGRIAFTSTRDGSPWIYVANADGSEVTRLVSGHGPAWSPDGSRIAFYRGGEYGRLRPASEGDVFVMDADGSDETWLATGVDPSWSPDGTRIVFVDGEDGISVMAADGSGVERLIAGDAVLNGIVGVVAQAPVWSPDGRTIAFDRTIDDGFGEWYGNVHVMNADGSEPRMLWPGYVWDGVGTQWSADFNPSWSPDGGRLAYWKVVPFQHGNALLAQERPSASGHAEVVVSAASRAWIAIGRIAWSPDGAAIAASGALYEDWRGWHGPRRILAVPVGGRGAPVQLVPDAHDPARPVYRDYDPVWTGVR